MPEIHVKGILNVNKPEGRTSFSIVTLLRRLSGERRIGYTGTLDPFASGVLPVCLGQATKISRFISESNKVYLATIELGVTTDTYDREGKITDQKDPGDIEESTVRNALGLFSGFIEQIPPNFSAIKIQGRKSYLLARSGASIQHKPRIINIINIEICHINLPLIVVKIECSKGTYIRSLAHDLGQKLGCGAYLKALVRTRCGVFEIENALSLETVENAFHTNRWKDLLYPLDYAISNWDKTVLSGEDQKLLQNGSYLNLTRRPSKSDELICAYDAYGNMVAVLKFDPVKQQWKHEIMFTM